MSAIASFEHISMCWNAYNVKPFAFDNTMEVSADEPLEHLMAWTGTVARGAPGGKLKALVINCHGWYGNDYTSTMDSAGGVPRDSGGLGLNVGDGGIGSLNAGSLFKTLEGRVSEIHIYGCGVANTYTPLTTGVPIRICQIIADASRAIVVASDSTQPDVPGPGLNLAPPWVGRVMRFKPST